MVSSEKLLSRILINIVATLIVEFFVCFLQKDLYHSGRKTKQHLTQNQNIFKSKISMYLTNDAKLRMKFFLNPITLRCIAQSVTFDIIDAEYHEYCMCNHAIHMNCAQCSPGSVFIDETFVCFSCTKLVHNKYIDAIQY